MDGLAGHLVSDWCTISAPETGSWVRTQVPTTSGNYVDLEIGFGPQTAPALRIWVEIKHGADLHESQLSNYRHDLGLQVQHDSRLVVLAPRGAVEGDEADVTIAWQDVAVAVSAYAAIRDPGPIDSWLLNEFALYLKEEALMDEEALSPAHVFALSARPATDRTIERLTELAQNLVVNELGQPKNFAKRGAKQPAYGIGWWANYPASESEDTAIRWGDAWLEWTCRSDEFRSEPHDGIAFLVGASFQKMQGSALSRPENAAWVAELQADGFERVQAWFWRLWRPLYPEHLMNEPTLPRQAERLADWVVAGMRDLRASPPPA